MNDEQELAVVHPAMFRSAPVGFVLMVLASLFLVGLPFLIYWWLQSRGTTLTITTKRSILRRGILSKNTTEVLHEHIRNIQVAQTFGQRLFGVGTLAISSAGQAGIEIEISGVPHPEQIQAMIDKYR